MSAYKKLNNYILLTTNSKINLKTLNLNKGQSYFLLDWGLKNPKSPKPTGHWGPSLNTTLLRVTQASVLNGIPFHPTALT